MDLPSLVCGMTDSCIASEAAGHHYSCECDTRCQMCGSDVDPVLGYLGKSGAVTQGKRAPDFWYLPSTQGYHWPLKRENV